MEKFEGNSNASKRIDESTKITEPITSNVTIKKKGLFGNKLFSEDAKSVGAHVIDTVFLPSIKKLISDAVKNAIDWLIYGTKGSGSSNVSGIRNVTYTNYNGISRSTPQSLRSDIFSFEEFEFEERSDAELVLQELRNDVARYGMASVSDYYDLISQKSDYTSQKYGWRNLDTAQVVPSGRKYAIRFPKVMPLE